MIETGEPQAPVAPATVRTRLVLATLCAGTFMGMLDNVVVTNALPRMSSSLGVGISGLQWAVEGYSLVFAALLLPGGALGDRYGRRRCYLGGLALFTLGSAVSALAPALGILLTGRAIQGVGAAALIPQSLAILRVTYSDTRAQARAFAIWSAVSALGLALGPMIGGPLVDSFGWPSAFWINVPVGILTIALGLQVIPGTIGTGRRSAERANDPMSQAALAIGLALLVYALIEGPGRGWASPSVLSALILSVLAAAYLAAAGSRARKAVDLTLLRDRIVASAIFTGFAVTFGMFGVVTFLGLFMQVVLGWSPTGAGFASLPSTALVIVMSPVASRLTLKCGPRLPLSLGLLCCASALFLLSYFGLGASYAGYWWALPLMGMGMGLCYTPVTIVVMTRATTGRFGNSSAIISVSREVGGTAGIAVMGTLLSTRMRTSLTGRLVALNLRRQDIDQIVSSTGTGGRGGFASMNSATMPLALRSDIAQSFVSGLHFALWAAGILLILCAGVIQYTMRPGSLSIADPRS